MKKLISILTVISLLPLFCGGGREERITFAAVGDDLIHTSVYMGAATGAGFDFSPVYAAVAERISGADVAFVNQETMLGTCGYSGYPRFRSPVEVGEALAAAGFDVVNIANNHSLDAGEAGFLFTLEYLSGVCECVVGDGGVKTVERGGMKIAFLSYTYATNCGLSACVSRFDENTARREIAQARTIADAVVVSMHWGEEYDTGRYIEKFEPTEKQRQQARLLASLGADVIIGTHPHVIERAEWIEAGDRRAFCAYSLGNFVSNMRYGASCLGAMLTVDFVRSGGVVTVENPKLVPTVCHYDEHHRGHRVCFLDDYTDEMAALHGTHGEKNEKTFCVASLRELFENNVDKEFR